MSTFLRLANTYHSKLSKGDFAVCAFARHLQEHWVIIVIPLGRGKSLLDGTANWTNESIVLGPDLPSNWINIFTGKEIETAGELPVSDALGKFPIALLTNKKA